MIPLVRAIVLSLSAVFRSRASMQLEILALRHQIAVYQRTVKRPKIRPADRLLWSWLACRWAGWRDAVVFVKPATVVAWQRKRFRDHWRRICGGGTHGRPPISSATISLIRRMSMANVTWGAPRIVGELQKIGIDVAQSTVEKYMTRRRPGSSSWKSFIRNHMKDIVAVDFFVVPTIRNRVLFVFLVLSLDRRKVLHFNVTANPTAEWTAQQMLEAFPWETIPRYLIRDQDGVYGNVFSKRLCAIGLEEVRTAPGSPWQNGYVERLIGSIRRECLDHVVVLNERHLKRVLRGYFSYYHRWRTHQSLDLDAPEGRALSRAGRVIEVPEAGGLHHHYERMAA